MLASNAYDGTVILSRDPISKVPRKEINTSVVVVHIEMTKTALSASMLFHH